MKGEGKGNFIRQEETRRKRHPEPRIDEGMNKWPRFYVYSIGCHVYCTSDNDCAS